MRSYHICSTRDPRFRTCVGGKCFPLRWSEERVCGGTEDGAAVGHAGVMVRSTRHGLYPWQFGCVSSASHTFAGVQAVMHSSDGQWHVVARPAGAGGTLTVGHVISAAMPPQNSLARKRCRTATHIACLHATLS